jgi:hypothetical protein
MASSTQLIQLIYAMLAEGNLSQTLPLMDEQVSIQISESLDCGEVYHGRSGFFYLLSSVYESADTLVWEPLTYFTPAGDSPDEAIVAVGALRSTLAGKEAAFVRPFMHHWLLQNEKVTGLRAFHPDANMVLW